MSSKAYTDDSIKALTGAERVRTKPSVMLGDSGVNGAFHTVNEIVSNALDEARAGYGSKVEITRGADKSITVRDYGRGVPMGWNEKAGRFNWDLIFNELYAGGKYTDDGSYGFTLGTNGLGSAVTQYTSEYFEVRSYREGKCFYKRFEGGYPTSEEMLVEESSEPTGTWIKWKVDDKVFSNTDFTFKMFKDYLESQAHLNRVEIVFTDEFEGKDLHVEGKGLENFLSESVKGVKALLSETYDETLFIRGGKYKSRLELVVAIARDSRVRLAFHNTGRMTGGVHYDATDTAIKEFFKTVGKAKGVAFVEADYSGMFSFGVSTFLSANVTSFYGQTKSAVTNVELYNFIYEKTLEKLNKAYLANHRELNSAVNEAYENAINRIAIEEFAKSERKIKKAAKSVKVDKFAGCRSTDASKRELYILEGDSALGACKVARDAGYQALLAVKGKPINCMKHDMTKVLENVEVQNLIAVLGCGIEGRGGTGNFNLAGLNYDKVIICTDADVDGFQIRMLFFGLFYKLMPKLLEGGKVFVAESPLYEFVTSKGSFWAYSESEKDVVMRSIESQGLKIERINRSKGLGENDPDMLWETTFDPKTRRLSRLDVSLDDEAVRFVTGAVLGTAVTWRRKAVLDYIETASADAVLD